MTKQEFLAGTPFKKGNSYFQFKPIEGSTPHSALGFVERLYLSQITPNKVFHTSYEANVNRVTSSRAYAFTYILGKMVAPVLIFKDLEKIEVVF